MLLIAAFFISFLIASLSIPSIINVAREKQLFDSSSERKLQQARVSSLGGMAIFPAFVVSCCLFIPDKLPYYNMFIAIAMVHFLAGLKDDMIALRPGTKFNVQIISSLMITLMADLRIKDLSGLFGFGELNYIVSIVLSVFVIVGTVNAYNLIDGIDGLAGSLGLLLSITYGYLFYQAGEISWAYISVNLGGALCGFLKHNMSPAKIFMGDSGSLTLGFIAAILSIKFMELSSKEAIMIAARPLQANIALVLAVLSLPVFDTLRVFALRVLKGKSPFSGDFNHIHHRLLALGLSHLQATLLLLLVNGFLVLFAFNCQFLGNTALIALIAILLISLNGVLTLYTLRHKKAKLLYDSR